MSELVLGRLIGDDHFLDKRREDQLKHILKSLKFNYFWTRDSGFVDETKISKKKVFQFEISSRKKHKLKVITSSHFIINGHILKRKMDINKDFLTLIKTEAYKRFMIMYILQAEDKLGRGDWKEVTFICYLSSRITNLRDHRGCPKSKRFMHLYSLSINEIFNVFLTKINPKPI